LAISGVYAWIILVIAEAGFEGAILSVVWGIEGTPDAIVNVFAKVCSVGTGRVTSFETKLSATHEIVPFEDLLVGVVIAAPSRRIKETTEGVSSSISTVRIQLSPAIAILDVDLLLVDEPNNLNIIGRPHELNALERSGRNGASPTPRLRAPGDFLTFGIGNEGVGLGGSPEAEIVGRI